MSQPATSVIAAFVLVLILWLIIISVAMYVALTFYICIFPVFLSGSFSPSFLYFLLCILVLQTCTSCLLSHLLSSFFCLPFSQPFILPVSQYYILPVSLSFIPPISRYLSSVQGFQDLCDETHSWINENDQALSTEDYGRHLSTVQALQRRHQVRPTSTYFSYCR